MSQPPSRKFINRLSLTRRRFLERLGQLSAAPVLLLPGQMRVPQPPAPPTDVRIHLGAPPQPRSPGTGPKTVLTQNDFTYVGAFRLPASVGGHDAMWGRTLTVRYVDQEPRLLTMTLDHTVYEVRIPNVAVGSGFPEAKVTRILGDITLNRRTGLVFGLYWDPIDARLYWTSGRTYNTTQPQLPSVGYSLLDDDTGKAIEVEGAWAFRGRGSKPTMGGVLPIPRWFADQYCQGRRLGAGFGGYWSIVATGPAHMGPALCAFAPPDRGTLDRNASLAYTNLVGYPFNVKPYTTPDRCHRDTDYHTEFDGWNPKDGIGYWTWADWLWQGAVWIDAPDRHGVVFFPTLGRGRVWYGNATINAERAAHAWYVYDPLDLAQVAQGKDQSKIQPRNTWDVHYENIRYPMGAWRDEPWNMVTGSSYDESTRRLYIAVRFAYGTRPSSRHMVYVYELR
jgi:hypothetical protein